MLSDKSSYDNKKILIFDGECAFCNQSVLFIRKRNKKDNIWYCSSQSEKGIELMEKFNTSVSADDSLIYLKNGQPYYYSNAALEVAKELDHFWAMLSIFLIIPHSIRDHVYRFIAKRRKLIMGNSKTCSLENADHFQGKIWT